LPFDSEEQSSGYEVIFKTPFLALFPISSALPLRSVVAGFALLLGSLEGVSGAARFEWGEVPHDAGVAWVDLNILHFLSF